jgi:hypothetical protein
MERAAITGPQERLLRRCAVRPREVRAATLTPARALDRLGLASLAGALVAGRWVYTLRITDLGKSWLSADPTANVVGEQEPQ